MWGAIIAALVISCLLYAQKKHYDFLQRQEELRKGIELDSKISESLKEFTEYKKRVDVLTLKAGLKL